MKYENIREGRFCSRPNRFIAYVEIAGELTRVHVKNTGRCRELLTEDAEVFLEKSANPHRSTAYDLIAVKKGSRLINIDSQAPNKAVEEWLLQGGLFSDAVTVKPETAYGSSRFDFYVETEKDRIFIEVKGVTLEEEGIVRFPDAPSQRAVKHLKELEAAVREGYKAYVIFVIQMEDVKFFTPNTDTHAQFAEALLEAGKAGVQVLAYDCRVQPDTLEIHQPVPVKLSVLDRIADPLLAWYDQGRRALPWREEPTPYHVWVSEIMLQQTRVEAVKPYYDRFMKALPDIRYLAQAPEEELLKLWEGLGYYNRVRNLQKAAQTIMEACGGRMPEDYESLQMLPGIGSYTAGAVSSIAFGKREPAVDGNVLRVLSRLRADERDISKPAVRRQIEEELRTCMPSERPGDFNQALMELGAIVCVPGGTPHCSGCPWKDLCLAHRQKRETCFPYKPPRKQRRVEEKTILVLLDENRIALKKRPDKGLLAGMYEFPSLEGKLKQKQVLNYLKEEGLSVLQIEKLEGSRHIFSHREWHMIGYRIRVDELAPGKQKNGLIFADRDEIEEKYPIPSAYDAYRNL